MANHTFRFPGCAFCRLALSFLLLIGFASLSYSTFGTFSSPNASFSGSAALADTRRATGFGERPPGSEALQRLRTWINAQLSPLGCQVIPDSFSAETPDGKREMTNIIFKFPGTSGKAVVISGHYDTLYKPMLHFVGANDAGSSTGFLVEMARVLSRTKHPDDIYIVFFDGEEAIRQWTETDSLYGSRHLTAKWGADGTLARIKALINVDMIGDASLGILNDENSSQSLRTMMWQAADKLGDAQYFLHERAGIDDDHIPFVQAGVNALDIIDFNYGPQNSYWHTAADTMDKLSAHSLQVVGDVVLEMIAALEHQPS
jgi:Zn-dependent M28 family amino/carboxypeptidase